MTNTKLKEKSTKAETIDLLSLEEKFRTSTLLELVSSILATTIELTDPKFAEGVCKFNDIIEDIKPKDHIESMLAAQMIATHHAAMRCFKIATRSEYMDGINVGLTCANKLTRSYAMQMEALNKYRGKGQQKMTVEHVHINDGGQAIIGNISASKKVTELKEVK